MLQTEIQLWNGFGKIWTFGLKFPDFRYVFLLRENTFSVQTKYVQSATYETTFCTVFLGIFLHKSNFTTK